MDAFSSIFTWLSDHEAGISAVAAIIVIAGVVFAGFRWLVSRRSQPTPEKASSGSTEATTATDSSVTDLDPLTVPGFEGRPAIAVLPFDNLSGDPEQEYFADGIAEDLITRLSAWREFPVIARNSSFIYKGKAVDVKQVSRELGVRYVLEGSVRKADDRVRISAQLIDATTGAHLWANRYDRGLEDIFAIQDEITEAIAGAMRPGLWHVEQEHARHRPTHDLTAWDWCQRGFWHPFGSKKEDTAEARTLFERAIDLDPDFALAFVGIALTHFADHWSGSSELALAGLVRAAEKRVRLGLEPWKLFPA